MLVPQLPNVSSAFGAITSQPFTLSSRRTWKNVTRNEDKSYLGRFLAPGELRGGDDVADGAPPMDQHADDLR